MNTTKIAKYLSDHRVEIRRGIRNGLMDFVIFSTLTDVFRRNRRSDWDHDPTIVHRDPNENTPEWKETNRFQDPVDGSIWVRYQHR